MSNLTLAQIFARQAQPQQPFAYQPPEPQIAIPQQAAAPFYNLPSLETLLQPGVATEVTAPRSPIPPRNFDSLFPGYRESTNVEDRRGRFDDMMYAAELRERDPYWEQFDYDREHDWEARGRRAPLMKRNQTPSVADVFGDDTINASPARRQFTPEELATFGPQTPGWGSPGLPPPLMPQASRSPETEEDYDRPMRAAPRRRR